MAPSDGEAAPLVDELALARWGIRFALPKTEAAYRTWHARQTLPFVRIIYFATLVFILPGALVAGLVISGAFGPIATGVLLYAPCLLAGTAATYRPSMARWIAIISVLNNSLGGCLFVLLSFHALHRPDIALCSVVIAGFIASTMLRLHPAQAGLAALPYFVLAEVLTARLSGGDLILYSLMLLIAATTGLIVAWTGSRTLRSAYRQERIIEAQQKMIEHERDRADDLLHNVLPVEIAARLKKDPTRIADHFDAVTVLFGDIAGFTPLSAEMSPQELVAALDEVFTAFDDIAQRHGLEKIKTIGDAYMVVGGIPTPRDDHAQAVARMALEMRDLVAQRRFLGTRQLRMRIGIHTGPAVAGVIGKKKFIYDLWGDTVNTASRMESHGAPGEIQVTDATRVLLGDGWLFDGGAISEIKGKGPMRTWWLKGRADSNR